MFSKKFGRSNGLTWGLAASLAACVISGPMAIAQDSGSEELEEVVVRGIRYSQQQAIGIKRNAIGVVDAISADDIGKLPDKNAAEAVDRLPGVSISTDQGEGRYVQ